MRALTPKKSPRQPPLTDILTSQPEFAMTWLQAFTCYCGPLVCPPLFQGLSTVRSARADLSTRLESATGRSGAYPDRTCTC